MLQEEFVGEGTSARTSLAVFCHYCAMKCLLSNVLPSWSRGAQSLESTEYYTLAWPSAYAVSTAGVQVVREGKATLCPNGLYCGLPLERNVQNTDILGTFISNTFPYFPFFSKKSGKAGKPRTWRKSGNVSKLLKFNWGSNILRRFAFQYLGWGNENVELRKRCGICVFGNTGR